MLIKKIQSAYIHKKLRKFFTLHWDAFSFCPPKNLADPSSWGFQPPRDWGRISTQVYHVTRGGTASSSHGGIWSTWFWGLNCTNLFDVNKEQHQLLENQDSTTSLQLYKLNQQWINVTNQYYNRSQTIAFAEICVSTSVCEEHSIEIIIWCWKYQVLDAKIFRWRSPIV